MPLVVLSHSDREQLHHLARSTPSTHVLKRAQTLLALADGTPPEEVASREHVSRSTVYGWAHRYGEGPFTEATLEDAARSGRPPTERERTKAILAELTPRSPTAYGYRHTVWTAALLQHHLLVQHVLAISESTLRRALHELGYRWKRPRFVLSRRDPNWRQAKGGFSEG